MLPKPNFTSVTFVTLIIKVMGPKQIGFFRGLWGSHILSFNMIDVKVFQVLHGKKCIWTDRQTDGQRHNIIYPSCDERIKILSILKIPKSSCWTLVKCQVHCIYTRVPSSCHGLKNGAKNYFWPFCTQWLQNPRLLPPSQYPFSLGLDKCLCQGSSR